MNNGIINEILEKIKVFNKVAIYRHVFPDPDCYGSQVGLKSIIEATFPEKKVILLGEQNEKLSYIGKMTEESEVEIDKDTLAIILDVSNKERVDNQSFIDAGFRIKIDHHEPFTKPYEDLTWVDTNYSSCCEMILDIYLENKDIINITQEGRKALFAGIISDTGRFVYVENPTELLKKVSEITYDFNTKEIYSNLYRREKTELEFLGYIYQNFEVTDNGVAYLKIPKKVINEYNLETIKAARMVNALQDCNGIINWLFFAEKENGEILSEFRSSGPIVNEIANKFGGGGHKLAAGATLRDWNQVNEIIREFDKNCKFD